MGVIISYTSGIAEESAYTHTMRVLNKKLKLTIKQKSILLQKIMIIFIINGQKFFLLNFFSDTKKHKVK